jgi:hypothetical protein
VVLRVRVGETVRETERVWEGETVRVAKAEGLERVGLTVCVPERDRETVTVRLGLTVWLVLFV